MERHIQHFQYWVLLTLFSIVTLTSLTNSFKNDEQNDTNEWTKRQRWVISMAAISLILSMVACGGHLVTHDKFCEKPIELPLAVLVLAIWCAGLPTLMDQDQDFAVTVSISNTDAELSILDLNALNAGVDKANLFFSAWGALISALLLVTRHFELYFKREDDKHLYHWVGFATAGIIIMSDTARFWKTYKCKDFEDNEICNRNMFALILGAFSCVVGLAMVLAPIPLFFAQLTSSVMLVAWCCGISYLTFDEGPAIHQGIIYFASWASLLFVLAVAAPALLELFHTLSGRDAAPSAVEAEVLPTKEEVVEMKGGGDEAEEEEIAEKEGTETA